MKNIDSKDTTEAGVKAMSDEIKRTEEEMNRQNDSFEQIINLVSEIVVIKARLQQLMDSLVSESRESRSIKETVNSLTVLSQAFEKTIARIGEKDAQKEFSAIQEQFANVGTKITNSSINSLVLDLDEVTGRFGKVLGELQSVLMKMRSGSSSIAIMQVLLVEVNSAIFAFPLEAVLEIVKIKKDEIYSVDGNETIRLREHALGLISLDKTIGIKALYDDTRAEKRVVVITNGTEQVGVIVDSLLGEEDIVSKKLSSHFKRVRGVRGASILGDGQVALILDVSEIIAQAQRV
jgi:two-component system chemotaxis sensor kinase CheA